MERVVSVLNDQRNLPSENVTRALKARKPSALILGRKEIA